MKRRLRRRRNPAARRSIAVHRGEGVVHARRERAHGNLDELPQRKCDVLDRRSRDSDHERVLKRLRPAIVDRIARVNVDEDVIAHDEIARLHPELEYGIGLHGDLHDRVVVDRLQVAVARRDDLRPDRICRIDLPGRLRFLLTNLLGIKAVDGRIEIRGHAREDRFGTDRVRHVMDEVDEDPRLMMARNTPAVTAM